MRSTWCALLALSACYSPSVVGGAPCDLAQDNCPTGQSCMATAEGAFCSGATNRPDAGSDPDKCLGSQLLAGVCLKALPTKQVVLSGMTIDTSSTTACTEILPQASGPALCVVAGTTINIPTGATLRALGANPLVLFATGGINIAGTIDVSSHAGETLGGAPAVGAGGRSAAACTATGSDGALGAMLNNRFYGAGGAAGGSFGGTGGPGGKGGRGNITAGTPATRTAPTTLVGGCQGGHGGDGIGGGGGASGGAGGGAVYLVSRDSIAIAGKINASGAGGAGGGFGFDSSGGGGGGGAGGMIVLEAPKLAVSGTLYANGGGGGGGGGFSGVGASGGDPLGATPAATAGGGGAGGGGRGGTGSVAATAGTTGENGTNNDECAGGGGGGGPGVIRVYGAAPSSLTGAISPPAS